MSFSRPTAECLVAPAATCGRGDDRYVAVLSALENASRRPAVLRRSRFIYLQLQNRRRRIEWPAPGRDQQPESLHRYGADPTGGFSRDALDTIHLRIDHADDSPLGRFRTNGQPRRSVRCLLLLRHLLDRIVLVPALHLWAQSRSARADAHHAVHAPAPRHEANREFPRVQLPTARRLPALFFGVAHRARRLVLAKGASMKIPGSARLQRA